MRAQIFVPQYEKGRPRWRAVVHISGGAQFGLPGRGALGRHRRKKGRSGCRFLLTPFQRLPFPSLLVASENDPYLPIEVAAPLASAWGAQFVDAGRQGHINVESGHGRWPAGEGLLRGFVARS